MKEIVKINEDQGEAAAQLRDLLMRRDDMKKEIRAIRLEFLRIFGQERAEEFGLQVNAARLKKEIAWIVRRLNVGEAVDPEMMKADIDKMMKTLEAHLQSMTLEIMTAKSGEPVSEGDMKSIRTIYRRIAKRLHPDLHPEFAANEDVLQLWHAVSLAYECNDLEELENLELRLDVLLEELENPDARDFEFTFDPQKRKERILDQIEELEKDPAYDLLEWIKSPERIEQRREIFQKSVEELKGYIESLEEKKRELLERSVQCPMH